MAGSFHNEMDGLSLKECGKQGLSFLWRERERERERSDNYGFWVLTPRSLEIFTELRVSFYNLEKGGTFYLYEK